MSFFNLFRRKENQDTIFQPWIDAGYRFESKSVYLGREQSLVSPDGNRRVFWSCTARDGISMQIKHLHPWHIQFEYMDGGVMINEDSQEAKTALQEIHAELEGLRSKSREVSQTILQKELDEIVLRCLGKVGRIL